MNQLYPIIRRARRPLLPPDEPRHEETRPAVATSPNGPQEQPQRGGLVVARPTDKVLSSVAAASAPECRPDGASADATPGHYKEAAPTELAEGKDMLAPLLSVPATSTVKPRRQRKNETKPKDS